MASVPAHLKHTCKYLVRSYIPLILFAVTLFPISLTVDLWQEIWTGMRPSAWDGSGHFTLARIYSDTIFPDTFGWTWSFFGGMPHPNNYPPLFYWLIALLDHLPLISFNTAFKVVLVLPTLLLPAATWFLAWKVLNKNQWIAFCSALAITPLLVDQRFFITSGPLGITYMSTFLTGLYSHPLGYLFLILWYAIYSDRHQPLWRVALAALLLAGSLLSSFFGASVTALFVISTLIYDLLRFRQAEDPESRKQARQSFIGHFASPVIAGCLTLFWLAPVIATRDYIVTQPSSIPFGELVPPALLIWYAIAGAGIILWLRRRRPASTGVYLAVCVVLAVIIFLSGVIAPSWFPLHPARLLATLNFLLAVPVGLATAFLFGRLAGLLGIILIVTRLGASLTAGQDHPDEQNKTSRTSDASARPLTSLLNDLHAWQIVGIVIVLVCGAVIVFKGIKPASYHLAFYPTADREAIDPILNFAKTHQDGRYLVEIPPFEDIAAGHEGRAINNYLPAGGNQVLTLFFREASPSIVFFSPIVDRFSVQADPTGISSVLSDDIDFARQNFAMHMQQARLLGVRYLVIRSPWARNYLIGQEPEIKRRHNVGAWTIYEINWEPEKHVRALAYKPALVVSTLNLKGRRSNDWDFVRFSEEQLADAWYDVLLARSPETKLDKLKPEEGFGALIVDRYDYYDEQAAFDNLRAFAQARQLILLESDAPLFRRIEASLAEFPRAEIIRRVLEEPGEWLKPGAPSRSYSMSQIRQVWQQLRQTLDLHKVPIGAIEKNAISGGTGQNAVDIETTESLAEAVPVVIDTTYHPSWRRTDEKNIYPVTPFFMLTFVDRTAKLRFARTPFDRMGVWISLIALLLLGGALIWRYGGNLINIIRKNSIPGEKSPPNDTQKEFHTKVNE